MGGTPMTAVNKNIAHLNALYEGRHPYHGEMHDHADTGGTSDGQCTLSEWTDRMKMLRMDFAAILDHRQVRHMYQPEWEDGLFLCGTEPGTRILDPDFIREMHYNLLTPTPAVLEELLAEFEEYEFEGGIEGHFRYPDFTPERFGELIDALKAKGGFFVHPHPTLMFSSDNALHYWFRDETAIEVFYKSPASRYSDGGYKVWTELLERGKRIWAIAGGDGHAQCSDKALTTIYARERTNAAFLEHLREGDFTCGAVGIRMCIGNTRMGGMCSFSEASAADGGHAHLTVGIGDFHVSILDETHSWRLDILDDRGTVCSHPVTCSEPVYFSAEIDAGRRFYRVEVWDETKNMRIAIGNPIWNTDCME